MGAIPTLTSSRLSATNYVTGKYPVRVALAAALDSMSILDVLEG